MKEYIVNTDYFWFGFWMILISIWSAKSFAAALFVGGFMLIILSIMQWISNES